MSLQKPNAEPVVTVQQEIKQVYFIVYASAEDFQSLESVIREWKLKNNKTFDQISVVSELKNIPVVQINDKK